MGFKTLIYMILKQAFEDYNELLSAGATYSVNHKFLQTETSFRSHKPAYAIGEIQDFFRSDWCETLLCIIEKDQDVKIRQMINTVLDGKYTVSLDVVMEYNGKSQTLTQWANEYGIGYKTLYKRLTLGWDFGSALATPIGQIGCAM